MQVSSLALDPIEKKPLARFHQGSLILSVGGVGCTLHCPWCQNYHIACPADPQAVPTKEISPEDIAGEAARLVPRGNIGVAYTYNEPLLHWRDVLECAKAVKAQPIPAGSPLVDMPEQLVNVLVTNGIASESVVQQLLPFVDAWNIDLKAFTQQDYEVCGGRLDVVQRTIELAAASSHVEVTTLLIPGYNDDLSAIDSAAQWLASLDADITWHLTRFHPDHLWTHLPPTPISTLLAAQDAAKRHLQHVYLGNV